MTNVAQRRDAFSREASPLTTPPQRLVNRPLSMGYTSGMNSNNSFNHERSQSFGLSSGLGPAPLAVQKDRSSGRHQNSISNTFAPKFIQSESSEKDNRVRGIEGENDFSGKRYVWVPDAKAAFVKGWVVEELESGRLLVQCDDGSVSSSALQLDRELR
jgi:myosin protein heavy chain